MKRLGKLIVLCLVAVPVVLHESFHAAVDPRSPLHSLNWMFVWATPLFEDENLVAGHVAVATLSFIGLSVFWISRAGERR